jgi:hypothetical protein
LPLILLFSDSVFPNTPPEEPAVLLIVGPIDHAMSDQRTKGLRWFAAATGLSLFIVVLPLLILALTLHLLASLFLYIAVWCCWCVRGRYVLFVYSDSPIWHDYVEEHMLPRLGERAVVLNWSQRSRWRNTLAVFVFRYFGGYRAFNPMAVVFRPYRLAQRFRFYEPFREFKHGNTDAVATMERKLYELVDEITGARAA